MRVIVDAHMVGQKETGNETYVLGLLSGLVHLPDLTVAAVVTASQNTASLEKLHNLEIIRLPSTNNWLRLGYYLPRMSSAWRADILHVTYIAPFFSKIPIVTSVHDVSHQVFPKFFSLRDRLLFTTLFPLSLRRSDAILTLSEFSKNEIWEKYPYLEKKTIHAVPLAAKSLFSSLEKKQLDQHILQKYSIRNQFILAVGNLQPRKNLSRLIEAFATLKSDVDVQLVIVGKAQWQASQVYKQVLDLKLEERVLFTGYVPDSELLHLYNAAIVFVYPSLYEGFGLPVLEAMACGTPVIASNTTSLPEVANDAAILVDPTNVSEIREAILEIIQAPELAKTLSRKGLLNIKNFSWRVTAEATAKVYRSIYKS